MRKTIDSVSNLVRAAVGLCLLAVIGAAGWFGYDHYLEKELAVEQRDALRLEVQEHKRQIESQQQEIARQKEEIQRLDMALRLVKVDHHLAKMTVVDRFTDEEGQEMTTVRFAEVDSEGNVLDGSQVHTYTVEGDTIHVDGLVAKFADEFVEQGDPLRGTSLFWFNRLFGEQEAPAEGYRLQPTRGARPYAYSQGRELTELEQEIWDNFWDYANNPQKAADAGLRAVHGQSVSMQLREGKSYLIELRSTGDLWIRPAEEKLPPRDTPASES